MVFTRSKKDMAGGRADEAMKMAMIRRSDKENNHSYLYLSALDHQLARMAGMSAPRAQQAPANADYRAASRRSSVKADVVRVMESIRSDGSQGQGIPSRRAAR